MKAIELARRLAQLNEKEDALRAYLLVLNDGDSSPAERMEAGAYTLDNGGDYKAAYTAFVQLYNAGHFRARILPLMKAVFYEPNVKLLKDRYERNCKLLSKYPYFFRKDFLPFDKLPLLFIPYDDHNGYVPYDPAADAFRGFVNVKDPIVGRNFFKDLEKPILADDVYSQYELEYLIDNVRPSEWVGRENHVYLHYTDWATFCAWLQVLTMRRLTESKKPVFLIEDEIAQYPIDFKERFGIDYSRSRLRPVGIREVNKLIWHTQLSTHNGGDFFNEILDGHPNLISLDSLMFDSFNTVAEEIRKALGESSCLAEAQARFEKWKAPDLIEDLYRLKDRTTKDILVAYYLREDRKRKQSDPASRIAPALLFQPHFGNILCKLRSDKKGRTVIESSAVEAVHEAHVLEEFPYIKTFTPMRRFTASLGGSVRAAYKSVSTSEKDSYLLDYTTVNSINRSFMRDPDERLYHDAIVVRFEDGKLYPKATFTRLAAFLDIPYTESMTYCSMGGERDPLAFETNVRGFDTSTVYKTYDEFIGDAERCYVEYLLRDAYEYYGFDFHYYDGKPLDMDKIRELAHNMHTVDGYIREMFKHILLKRPMGAKPTPDDDLTEEELKKVDDAMAPVIEQRITNAEIMQNGLYFINKRGQPLQMTPMLEPDPALMDGPAYH